MNKAYRDLLLVSSLTFLLLISSPSYSVFAQVSQTNWVGEGGNYPFNWDYSPQSQISPANIKNLQIKWVFPIPAAPAAYQTYQGAQGVSITPMIINGIVYAVTNYHLVLALDASSGKLLWQKSLPILTFQGIQQCSYFGWPARACRAGHYHGIWYTTKVRNTPLVWIAANNYTIFALNALTGDIVLKFSILEKTKVPGNYGLYDVITPMILIDENRGILLSGSSVSEGTDAGRGYFVAFDLTVDPPRELWKTFIIPPQDGSDPNWSIKSVQNMSYAYIFDGKQAIDLKALSPSQLNSMLYGDWGNFGFNGTHSFAGAGVGWGGTWALDPATGIAYVGTAQPAPDDNATTRPGPNLWSDSILAIDVRTGKIVWGFQTTAHDLWDWDCAWSPMLANATINGKLTKVVYKGCKNGYFYALDAATGKMYWYFNPPSIKYGPYSHLLNPLNKTEMTKPWQNYPSTDAVVQNPPGTGGIEANPAFDPKANLVFFASYNAPESFKVINVKGPNVPWGIVGRQPISSYIRTYNATVWALDASTGQPKWSFNIPSVGFRGGVTVSNGLVYAPTADGFIYIIDEQTGTLIHKQLIGAAMITEPAIASDTSGNSVIVMPASDVASQLLLTGFPSTPGFMFALGLGAPSVQTQVSTTTVVSSSVQTVVQTTGIAPEAFYGAVAVAVIFVIATGVLAARRRAPS